MIYSGVITGALLILLSMTDPLRIDFSFGLYSVKGTFEMSFVVVISAPLLLKGHKYTIFKKGALNNTWIKIQVYESSTGFRAAFSSEMQIPTVEPAARVEK